MEMVDILVGPRKQSFRVHKNRLCSRAPVFRKILNGSFKEAKEQCAELPEDDPEVFSMFLEWLYSQRIARLGKSAPDSTSSLDHIKLYCFAEKYCLSDLMDFAVSALFAFLVDATCLPILTTIQYVYEHTASGSPIRPFMIQVLQYVAIHKSDSGYWKTDDLCNMMIGCRELTMDYLQLVRETNGVYIHNPRKLDPCLFHVHGEKEVCSVKDN